MTPAVLIVDDSLTVRMDLVEAFELAGIRVFGCGSLAEARGILAREHIGLVVLDVLLPDGDGVDLLRELRADPTAGATPVLMLSSEAEVKDRVRGLTTGANEYVGKPYDATYVVDRAAELLGRRPSEQMLPSILVIEDSATFREVLTETFEAAGYRVLTADSGEAGLRVAASARPSAIVVDGQLPGIDGATVIRRVRLDGALRSTPCLLLTASDTPESELHALEAGADAFARKDGDLALVLARLTVLLRDGAGRGSLVTASLAGPKKVLAVDDSPTYLQLLAEMLRDDGYDPVLARSGEEALDVLAVQPVDCILLDLVMPGMGGQEACRRIKRSPAVRDTPLIMLTARDDREAMIAGLVAGADDFISKSADFEVLRARIRAQLRRKQFETEARGMREQLLRSELEAADARAARTLAEVKAALVEELERKNRELEAFCYSVSHDLQAPLRALEGFSTALIEDYGGALDETANGYLAHIETSARRMGELVDDLLALSRVTRAELHRERVDLSGTASSIARDLRTREPARQVEIEIEEGLWADADPGLLRVVLENLLGNAWKFTSKTASARIVVESEVRLGARVYRVRDNGAGFDAAYAHKLFGAFQRLHGEHEFPGTGIGLATVHRIVDRHGGRVAAEGAPGQGATFSFTLGPGALDPR